jgi:hypothetical protein
MIVFGPTLRLLAVVLALLGALTLHSPSGWAADQPNIMLMGDDADQDTVPRHSRIFNRVLDAFKNRMMQEGFAVFNETAITMDMTDAGRVRRTDAELISVAKNLTEAPIDVISVFQIYASAQDDSYSDIKKLRIRIVGRLLQVATGRDLGSFEVSMGPKGLSPIPLNCNEDCILETVGDQAKPIANEVGIILARKLRELAPESANDASTVVKGTVKAETSQATEECDGLRTAYTIVLNGYDTDVVQSIEKTMTGFKGYETHRPVKSQTLYSEYWYETCSDRARLERNFQVLGENLKGQNRVALTGNRIELEHVP